MRVFAITAMLAAAVCSAGTAAESTPGDNPPSQRIYLLPTYSCSGDDHRDPETIQTRKYNRNMVTDAFLTHIPESGLIVYGDEQWLDDTNASESELGYTESDLRRAIDTCPAGPDDTIVFYWNGHGGRPQHELSMSDNQPVVRSHVVAWITARNTRLSVVLTDTCAKTVIAEMAMAAPLIERPAVIAPLFHELFLRPRGVVNLNSASPGEWAFRANPFGSLFTLVLAGTAAPEGVPGEYFGYLLSNAGSRKSWRTVVSELQTNLTAFFKTRYPNGVDGQMDQHIWVMSLPGGSGPRTCIRHTCRLRSLFHRHRSRCVISRQQSYCGRVTCFRRYR